MSRRRVVLADDHPIFRAGLRSLLERQPDISIVGEASSGEEAVALVEKLDPDVLVLDIEMGEVDGVQVVERLRVRRLEVPILVLSAHDEEHYLDELDELGVAGFLTKEEAETQVVAAIRAVAAGQHGWTSPRIEERLARLRSRQGARIRLLSRREQEVLRHVAAGRVNKEIAVQLRVSPCTVKNHLANIFGKLGVHSRVEAVMAAQRLGHLPWAG